MKKPIFIVLSLSIVLAPLSFGAQPVNTIQDGRIVQGGTYYNTHDSRTTFINSGSGGLWIKNGTTVKGVEADAGGNPTNNGGTFHFYAPGNVVRIDGNIDVNGVLNSQGTPLGNGGKVFIDSAFLFQNGNIFANGLNGGLIQANVGAMTLGTGARTEAKGSGFGTDGQGGIVAINSTGVVDLKRGSTIDTSGRVLGQYNAATNSIIGRLDTNIINIEGSLVNVDGTLKADGVAVQYNGSRGGTIRLVSTGQSDMQGLKDALTAGMQTNPYDSSAPTITKADAAYILQRDSYLDNTHLGDIVVSYNPQLKNAGGMIMANGTGPLADRSNYYTRYDNNADPRAGDGGTIILVANNNVDNQGLIQSNGANALDGIQGDPAIIGGNGGTIAVLAQNNILNTGATIEANGGTGGSNRILGVQHGYAGGNGGLIAFSYNNQMTNNGKITANGAQGGNGDLNLDFFTDYSGMGGQGGLIVMSGDVNPTGGGLLSANGGAPRHVSDGLQFEPHSGIAGLVVSPNPTTLTMTQAVSQLGYDENGNPVNNPPTEQTQTSELLDQDDNLILLTRNSETSVSENFFERMGQAQIRSVHDPLGQLPTTRTDEIGAKNTSTSTYVYRNLIIGSSRDETTLNLSPSTANVGINNPIQLPNGLGYLKYNTYNTFSVANDGDVQNGGMVNGSVLAPNLIWSLGSEVDSQGTPIFNGDPILRDASIFGGGHAFILSNGEFRNENILATHGAYSGGSLNIASTELFSNGYGNIAGTLVSEGRLHGGSIGLKSNREIENSYTPNTFIPSTIHSDGRAIGGTISAISPLGFNNIDDGLITAKAYARDIQTQGGIISIKGDLIQNGLSGQTGNGSIPSISANAVDSPLGQGGYIQLVGSDVTNYAAIEANGGQQGGTIALAGYGFGDVVSEGIVVKSLTPPVTTLQDINTVSVSNYGILNTLGLRGLDGNIYLGGNEGVGLQTLNSSTKMTLNNVVVNTNDFRSSSNPNQLLQQIGRQINANGGQVYIVAGEALTNKAGQTRSAAEIVQGEAAPNNSSPNVNPLQDGQGSQFPNDFKFAD